jgi:hypothetical protein
MKRVILAVLCILLSAAAFAVVSPISGSPRMCVGLTRSLSDATPGGAWSSSNTLIASVDTAGAVTGVAPGIAIISYTAGAGYATMTVTVNDVPAVYLVTGGGSYCAGDTGVHIGLSMSDGSINYTLHNGALIMASVYGSGSALDFGLETMVGTYNVVATNNATTCTSNMTGTVSVSISPVVVPSVRISSSAGDTICLGASSIFTAVTSGGGSAPSYRWLVNGVNVGLDTAAYSFTPANGDVVKVIMGSGLACAAPDTVSDSIVMTVVPRVTPYVNLAAYPGDTVCLGQALMHTPVAAYGGTAPYFWWVVNGVPVGSGASFTYTPADGDTIYCAMVSNYFCRVTDTVYSPVVTIKTDTPVIPYINITAAPGYVIRPGANDTLVASVSGTAALVTYQWSKNGHAIPGATDSIYISNQFDTAYSDSMSCTIMTTDACKMTVYSWAYISIGYLGVGVLQGTMEGVALSPNPNNGRFMLHAAVEDGAYMATIDITDPLGRSVCHENQRVRNGVLSKQLDVSYLPSGVYFLSLRTAQRSCVVRFILEK